MKTLQLFFIYADRLTGGEVALGTAYFSKIYAAEFTLFWITPLFYFGNQQSSCWWNSR